MKDKEQHLSTTNITRKSKRGIAAGIAVTLAATLAVTTGTAHAATKTINIAVVSNPDMQRMIKLAPEFEKANPGIKLKFTTLDENTLRDKLTQAVGTKSGLFDAAMVGVVELPNWARNGWISNLQTRATSSKTYDLNDVIPTVRQALSYKGSLYAVPFYAESSFTMYRKDLFAKAGLKMPTQPTWDDIQNFAAKLNDPANNVAGICLRGQAGWGANMPIIVPMAHSYGTSVFDSNFKSNLTSDAFKKSFNQYIKIIKDSGEKGASNASFPECLSTFQSGNAAMWIDATVAASAVTDPAASKVAANVGFALMPKGSVNAGGWLWSWSLVQIATSKNPDATWKFLEWATSKNYIKLVTSKYGANLVPPGTRKSTYAMPAYQKAAAAYASMTINAINAAKSNYAGAADKERTFYVDIPEWTDCGTTVSQALNAAVAGQKTADEALANANTIANQCAVKGGYQK